MKEIRRHLFKARREDNGEWIEGGSIVRFSDENGEILYYMPAQTTNCSAIHDALTDNIIAIKGVFYKVRPETVSECTEFTDRDGTLLYEGDICILPDNDEYKGIEFVIKWEQPTTRFFLTGLGISELYDFENLAYKDILKIGNIHDREAQANDEQ